jgi:hypothetical protein
MRAAPAGLNGAGGASAEVILLSGPNWRQTDLWGSEAGAYAMDQRMPAFSAF